MCSQLKRMKDVTSNLIVSYNTNYSVQLFILMLPIQINNNEFIGQIATNELNDNLN